MRWRHKKPSYSAKAEYPVRRMGGAKRYPSLPRDGDGFRKELNPSYVLKWSLLAFVLMSCAYLYWLWKMAAEE